MDPAFWRGKRVLVTGHTGFKGAWLSLWLQALGARVSGLALGPDQEPSLFGVGRVSEKMKSMICDIRDLAAVERAVAASAPQIVLHLAAQSLVRRGYREPVETYATNVLGTVNVLDSVRRLTQASACLVVTSDKCYDNHEWVWPYRENDPMGGKDPYSSSKGCAELVVAAYRASFFGELGRGLASARAGNVIGGGDWSEDRLIPDIVRSFSKGENALIRQPDSIRAWQHVLDAVGGYLTLVEKLWGDPGRYGHGWNFGPNDEGSVPVHRIVETLATYWGDCAGWSRDRNSGPHEAHLLKLDSGKARNVLGWRPKLTIEQALEWIVVWHRAHLAGQDMRAFTLDQIERYQAL
jgi:CDP-glucose 4,6-dehydratase